MQLARSVRWKGLFVLMAVGMISLALAGLSANRAAADPPSGYHLAFDEEFNGTSLAGTKFNYVWTGYPGVTNTTDAVSVGNGCLTLTTYSTGSGASLQNWGGCVATNDSYQYTYGYTEARIKFNNTQGCNMAFWEESNAMFENPGSTPGRGNETDILEQRATDGNNNNVQNMDHINLWAGGYGSSSYDLNPSEPTVSGLGNGNWHTLGCLWTSSGYTFYVDGVQTYSYQPNALQNLLNGKLVSNGPQWLILGAGPGGAWCGTTPTNGYGSLTSSTTTMSVDYVRSYQLRPMAWNLGAGGSGTWNSTNTNWSFTDGTAGTTFSNGDNLHFSGSNGTVTIASGFTPTAGSLQFDSGNFTVTGGSLTLSDNIVSVAGSLTATIGSSIGGSFGIDFNGNGRLVLAGNNTYTGLTTVRQGSALNIQNANALGSTGDGTRVEQYAVLEIQGGITTAAEPLSLNASGLAWDGALKNVSGNNNYTGPITLQSDSYIGSASGTLTLSGGVSGAYALTIVGGGNVVINSVIGTGAGTLVNYGNLTLSAANTYTGTTTVGTGGTLKVNNTTGSGTGSGAVTVSSGAVISGSGIIAGPVSVAGTLAPGNGPGILTVSNQVTFQAGSTFSVDVDGLTAGSGYDQLATTGPVALAGSLLLSFGAFTPTGHDILFLVNNTGSGATTGMFQYADNARIGTFDGCNWYITYDANDVASPSLNGGNDVAIYSLAVPEPATLVLLATGLLGLLCFAWRKRRLGQGYASDTDAL